MTNLPIPLQVLYAGLAGTVLALIVATIQNNWSVRVFFLLALRLAIGWQFLFEGLYKVNSHLEGPTATNRPFTSEPYFRGAPGPVAAYMRKQFDDPLAIISAQAKPTKDITGEAFGKLSTAEQAAACPEPVAKQLDEMASQATEAVKAEAVKDILAADAAEAKALKDAKTDADKDKAKAKAETDRQAAKKKEETATEIAKERIAAAKAAYARWVYGAEGRPTKVKYITGDVMLSAPQRLAHLEWLRREVKAADERQAANLGNGHGTDQKRAAEYRTDLLVGESDLAKDARDFVAELKKELNGGKAVDEPASKTRGQLMDKVTMWFLVAVGTCLMAGLFTRLACLLGAGFLVMTYLTYPPFPWYPLAPNTEGNPLFVNKNVIECLALLALAVMPTGQWMGLDALVGRIFRRKRSAAAA